MKQLSSTAFGKLGALAVGAFLLSVTVVPNGLRHEKAPFLIIVLCMIVPYVRRVDREAVYIVCAGWIVTALYLGIGAHKVGASSALLNQILAVYIIAPAFWMVFGTFLFERFEYKWFVRVCLLSAALIPMQVFLSFYLWERGEIELVMKVAGTDRFNAVRTGDAIGVTLNSFGTMIFLIAGVFGLFVHRVSVPLLLLTTLMLAGIAVSGRDYLVLSVGLSLLMFVGSSVLAGKARPIWFAYIAAFMVIALVLSVTAKQFGVNVTNIFAKVGSELASGGGSIRSYQLEQLLQGINENYLLGSGHGVAIDEMYIRDKTRSWAYEILAVATVYRVGLIGAFVYALPFLLSAFRYLRLLSAKLTNQFDHFFMFGQTNFCVAVFSNPYLESVEFQWAYFVPYLYMLNRSKEEFGIRRNSRASSRTSTPPRSNGVRRA